MIKNTLLATSLACVGSTVAHSGETTPIPQMSVEQIETYSTQSANLEGSSAGIILPLFLLILVAIAAAGSGSDMIPSSASVI